MVLPLILALLQATPIRPVSTTAPASPQPTGGSVASWTLHFPGDLRWQQITPAGALLVSTDAALVGVDVERAQSHQRVDDDHIGSRLQHLERCCRRGHPDESLHQAAQAALFRLGLLEQ